MTFALGKIGVTPELPMGRVSGQKYISRFYSTHRKFEPKRVCLAIAIYSEPPLYGVEDSFTMTLNHWKEELPEFLNSLEKLRVQS